MSVVKHEFWQGEILAMAGGSVAHNRIAGNVLTGIKNALGDACDAFGSDMRLQSPGGLWTYPDVVVIWGAIELVEALDVRLALSEIYRRVF